MRNIIVIAGLFIGTALASTAFAMRVADVVNPRPSGGWVSDHADMLTPAEEEELNRLISAADAEFGAEIAVVTVVDVDAASPKDFATELFNHWGIGKKDTNNGVLVLMVASQRRLEMETGYGAETVLTDGWLKRMQQEEMVPHFKSGQFGRGISAGVRLSIDRMREYELTGQLVDPVRSKDSGRTPWWLSLLIVGGTVGTGAGAHRLVWRRRRTCPQCKKMMKLLAESADDVHLTEGQRTEEAIGSVDWQYWYCTDCQTNRLIGVGKFFSGYSRCPSCTHKTLSTQTNTLRAATRHSTGLAEVVSDCAHCSHHTRTTRVLPRLPDPPSSSSSSSSWSGGGGGGGSFGGGSSGGGGSGSSW